MCERCKGSFCSDVGLAPFAGAPHTTKNKQRLKERMHNIKGEHAPKVLRFSMDINSDVPGCLVGKKCLGERRGLDRRLRKDGDLFEVFWLERKTRRGLGDRLRLL